jgi:hypothetical protein
VLATIKKSKLSYSGIEQSKLEKIRAEQSRAGQLNSGILVPVLNSYSETRDPVLI